MESFQDFLLLPFLLPFPYLKQKQKAFWFDDNLGGISGLPSLILIW